MPDVVFGMLTKLATAAANAGVKRLLDQPPVAAAIEASIAATADAFASMEGVGDHLRRWCQTDDFNSLLTNFERGDRTPQSDAAVSSFVRVTGFFDGDRTYEMATAILHLFASRLEVELLKSPQGLPVLAAREEKQHRRTQAMIGSVLDANAGQEASLARTRSRFGEEVADIYRDLESLGLCAGDSPYHHETLTKYVAHVANMDGTDVHEIDVACRGLARDILDRIASIARLAANAQSRLEHLRQSFGYALTSPIAAEFEGMLDALDAIVRLVPRLPAASHLDVKQRARVPLAIADLREYIEQVEAVDASFRRLYLAACGRPCDEEGAMPADRVAARMEWYREYYRVLTRRWSKIADRTDLDEDAW